MKIKAILFNVLICVLYLGGKTNAQTPFYLDVNADIEKRIESILPLLTLEEKVAMCHAQSKFSSRGVPRLGIPQINMSDGPHGIRPEIMWDKWQHADWTNDSCTAFPALTCLAATFNPSMALAYGKAIGEEARYRNKDVLLGPGVNIYRTPLNGRNFEYMGEDPFLTSTMVVPYIKGVQENGVAACVKHFALNNQEKWRHSVDVQISDRALNEIYLPAFKAAVEKAGVWTLMGAYNKFRGQQCSHNDILLNQILKKEWKFDGVVISDWGGVHNAKEAALNGLDIEMGTGTNGLSTNNSDTYSNYYLANPFLTELKAGNIPVAVLDDKVRRILRLIFRTTMSKNRPFGSFASPEHATVARCIAEEGIVLLRNKNNILPLNPATVKTVAIIGENAIRKQTTGGGSSELKVKKEYSPLESLTKLLGEKVNIQFSMGYIAGKKTWDDNEPSKLNADSLLNAAVNLAKTSDVVLIFGGLNKNHFQDCEAGDRESYELPYNQNKLVTEIAKVNKNVVFVNISGNAVAMPWVGDVSGIVQAWYLGSEAGNALANVLCGKVNPSGKLPFSFPVKLTDCGAHSFGEIAFPGVNEKEEYKEDILVGYRWYDTKGISVLFPFGYGLSYTNFQFKNMRIPKTIAALQKTIEVSVEITNTGKMEGSEVVQVYVKDMEASVPRPEKELKAFKKVKLKAGETQTVILSLDRHSFEYYNEAKKQWTLEPGKFKILVGTSSRNIAIQEILTME